MKKLILITLTIATMALVGCASSATTTTTAGVDTAALSPNSATHYRLLSDPKSIREIDWSRPPRDLHVKGVLTNQGFQPVGNVLGRGRLCTEGTDFVNLKDGSFHSTGEATPQSPYVSGCKGRTGGFMPSSREIS
ncbi:MAG: hypothetical protein ABR517_02540 [Thermoanaerobaculia bacterium]